MDELLSFFLYSGRSPVGDTSAKEVGRDAVVRFDTIAAMIEREHEYERISQIWG